MIITLVRHGEPVRDAAGADAADPPLSPAGRRQMEVARTLVEADGFDAVWCSHLRRARESAEALIPGATLIADEDWAEFDRDTNKYLHWEDGAEIYARYLEGDLSPWGTTLEAFRERIWEAMERVRVAHPDSRVVVVTHGGVINNLFARLVGSPETSLLQPAYGSVNRFMYHPDEGWTPMEINAEAPVIAARR